MIPIILAGGAGTRLWPKSRKYWPKFLLKFNNKHSFLQSTYLRLKKLISKNKIFIITNKEHRFLIEENILEIDKQFDKTKIVPEPEIKNTLPAVSIAAKLVLEKYNDEIVGIFPSDHYIKDDTKFVEIIKSVLPFAEKGNIVTFGITPYREETGYGYIKISNIKYQISNNDVYKVEKFIEKPDVITARKLINTKKVFWNSGMFIFKPSVLLNELKKFQPKMYNAIMSWDLNIDSLKIIYDKVENLPVDKGIMEKTDKIVVHPMKIFWDDVGDWTAMDRIIKKDKNNNIFLGNNLDIGSKNISVINDKKIIVTVGLQDLVVVDTEDATLIASKKCAQYVRDVVKKFGDKNEVVLYHKTTPRPWGSYTVLEHKNDFKVKLIKILPKKRLSLQKHKIRDEQWFIVTGTAKVIVDNKTVILKPGENIFIPKYSAHRLENPFNKIVELIEISRGKYLGEDDIVRLKDDFERK